MTPDDSKHSGYWTTGAFIQACQRQNLVRQRLSIDRWVRRYSAGRWICLDRHPQNLGVWLESWLSLPSVIAVEKENSNFVCMEIEAGLIDEA